MRTYKYIVNEKKRTVVCLVYVKNERFVNAYNSDECMVFRGIAKCNDGDDFNAEFGKKLAKKRALVELSKFELSVMEIMFSDAYVNDVQSEYVRVMDAVDRKNYLKKHIKSLRKEILEDICPF